MPASDSLYTDQLPGRTLLLNEEEFLFYSGTAYLGIPHNKEFRERLLEGMRIYGTNYSSSRHSNLQLRVFETVEDFIASYTGAQAALTFSSGLLAGQVLVQVLQGSGRFIYAPGTHPALWRGTGDAPETGQAFEEWAGRLPQEVLSRPEQHFVLICNSLDPLHARNHSFDWLTRLSAEKQYTVIIDDSHGFGLTGADGAGIYSQLPHVPHVRLVVVSSLGKALGIPAGVVMGDRELVAELRASPFFGGASPAVPAYLYAFLHSQTIYREVRQKLFSNIALFRQRLERPEMFRSFDHFPVFNTDHHALCPYLQRHQVLISSFRYPTPADEPTTRIILNSLHTPEDLQRLTDLVNRFAPV